MAHNDSSTSIPAGLEPSILRGDAREVLRSLPEASVQSIITSPPYWGQRSYGTEPQLWGGDPECHHIWVATAPRRARGTDDTGSTTLYYQAAADPSSYEAQGGFACKCGAWRGELGQEATPEAFVAHLVSVFDEALRVLRPDGTLWVNLGSTYATYPSGNSPDRRWRYSQFQGKPQVGSEQAGRIDKRAPGWKRKELVPVPWMFALRMHEAGWWIRADVQWWKLNGKHENAEDRPFRAHEYVTMFTKTADPFYNEEAVRQPYVPSTVREIGVAYRSPSKKVNVDGQEYSLYDRQGAQDPSELKRRIIKSLAERGGSMLPDVWMLPTGNGEGRHVAVFPESLPEICITASTRPGDLVVDPFAGSGTTLRVARRLRRRSIGIELSTQSADFAEEKVSRPQGTDLRAFEEVRA